MIKAIKLSDYAKGALANHWGYIWGTSGVLWTAAKQKALEKTTDSDRANSRKYGSQWIGHMVADCSGLISGFFSRNKGKMVHGSDTMYRNWCQAKGTLRGGKRTDGKPLLPGTAVFNYDTVKGKYYHVGVFIGDGYVIEAMGAQHGVTTSKITRWGYWGELKGLDYSGMSSVQQVGGQGTGTQGTGTGDQGQEGLKDYCPTIRKGSKGESVELLQKALLKLDYDLGPCGVDGDFGSATKDAVKRYQRDRGLSVDGICGPQTWQALKKDVPELFAKEDGKQTERQPEGTGKESREKTEEESGEKSGEKMPGAEELYTVTLPGLSREAAEKLLAAYPEATMRKGA